MSQNPPVTGQPSTADLYALARNTRSWVVIIGWIVVIQATLAIGFGAIVGFQAAKANRARTDVAAYVACLDAGHTAGYCLDNS
jgi:hypothetical protein